MDVSLATVPSSGTGVYVGLELRRAGRSAYRARARIAPDGSVRVGSSRVAAGAEHALGPSVRVGTLRAGQVLHLEGAVDGSASVRLRVRAWTGAGAAPAWQAVHRDPSGSGPTRGRAAAWLHLFGSTPALVATVHSVAVTTPAGSTGEAPGPSTTGVPPGTKLHDHQGDLVITQAGSHYDSLDVHGFVTVQAPGVTITRSRIRGGVATGNRGLVTVIDPRAKGFTIEDSELAPDHPSVWLDALKGADFTARRLDIHGTVDAIKVHGNDAVVEDSWLHGLREFAHDPNQGGGPTHNDGVQILGGDHLRVMSNTIDGGNTSAVLITQGYAKASDVTVSRNWLDGGSCSVQMDNKPLSDMSGISVSDNRFGRGTVYAGCAVVARARVVVAVSGNTWQDDGSAVVLRRY